MRKFSNVRALLFLLAGLIIGCQSDSYSGDRTADAAKPAANPRLEAATSAANVHEGILRHELALPTGDRKTSAVLVEMLAQDEARLNRPYDYRIRVTNLTDTPLVKVVVREKKRESFAISKSDPVATEEGGWLNYSLDELAPAASRTIEITGVAKAEGKVTTCIAVDYRPTLCVDTTVTNPIIKLTKEAPAEVMLCEGIRYRYVVTNVGSGTERDVTVQETLPENVLAEDGSKDVRLSFGELPAGVSKEKIIRVKPSRIGRYTSSAVAHAPGGVEVKSEQVSTIVREPKLEVTLKGPASEYLNKVGTYTVKVSNTGDAPARRAVLGIDAGGHGEVSTVAILDDDAKVADATVASAQVAPRERVATAYRQEGINLDTIAPGESKTVKVNIRTTHEGTLHITSSALATCVAPATERMTTEIITLPALRLEMVDLDDPIRVGESVYYRVTVKNQGTGADKNIVLNATLPSELQFVSSTGPTEGKLEGQTLHFATLDSLAAGREAVWRIEAKAVKAGDVLMRVQMKSDSMAQPASESEPTRLY